MTVRADLTNIKFGKLIALYYVSTCRNNHARWMCKCECGNEKDILATHLVSGKIQSCGCITKSKIGPGHHQWTGIGEISGDIWSSIKRGANGSKGRRVLEFSISLQDAWDLFIKQQRKCALSGIILTFGNNKTASLDRVDSSKGYIKDNIQWVHKDINKMKMAYSNDYFIDTCKLIANYNGNTEPSINLND